MDNDAVIEKLTPRTRAVFLTHVLGYNALGERLLDVLRERHVPLVEDVCESHGATFQGRKLGTFGLASNFSFYYAHHMSTIEGGMVSTDDAEFYAMLRMLRAHGLVREAGSDAVKSRYAEAHPDLTPEFIFAAARLQRALDRDQRGAGSLAAAPPRRQQRAPAQQPRGLPAPPRRQQVRDRVRDRGKLQLRSSRWCCATRTTPCAIA